jgi:hypothetical protein
VSISPQAQRGLVVDAIDGVIHVPAALKHGAATKRRSQFLMEENKRKTKIEYLIVVGVVSMMALYVFAH